MTARGTTRVLRPVPVSTLFDTQEAAAHAVNAAIRRAGLAGKRRMNAVVDGQLVPKKRKANGHGPKALRKRRRRLVGDSP